MDNMFIVAIEAVCPELRQKPKMTDHERFMARMDALERDMWMEEVERQAKRLRAVNTSPAHSLDCLITDINDFDF